MDTNLSTGKTPTTTSLTSVVSNAIKTSDCRDRFVAAVDYFIHYIESSSNYRAVFLPIGVLDYDGDPEADLTEMRSLWVNLVCLFGEPISGRSEFGYITMVPEARKYLKLLRFILKNP
ncbi:MAG: hypothetical protein NC114_09855, partial [Ruminococcus flavefaciens]|nr:hypothetical protein [Ruminococcus flavefaciens]